MSNKRDLKAYVRYDGTGRVISGSLILQRNKPKVGNWIETPAYECCNPSTPVPILLYDFSRTSVYTGMSTSVLDLSGAGNDGIPVSGNGNGVVETIPNSGVSYDSMAGKLVYVSRILNQHSVVLPDAFKFAGRTPYTVNIWFQADLSAPKDTIQGLISSEGRSFGAPIGTSFIFVSSGVNSSVVFYRWNGNTFTADLLTATFNTNGLPPFTQNTWYMASFGYDGDRMFLKVFDTKGLIYNNNKSSFANVSTSPSWSAFLGLRYNEWFKGSIGYVDAYDTWIGTSNVNNIYNTTKTNNGY